MRLEQLRYVITIANCKSLSKAARDLFLTQPTLSVNLQNLEAELGFPLFIRSHSGMELTEKGAEFYRIALRIQGELDQLQQLSAPEEEGGEVFLAAVPSFCSAIMLPMLTRLKQSEPELTVHIQESKRAELLPLLLERKARLAIGVYTDEEGLSLRQTAAQNRILIEPLLKDWMYVYLPKRHPLAYEEQVRLAQLEGENVILLRNSAAEHREDEIPHCTKARYFCFSERDSVMRAVSRGMGYAVLPGLMAHDNLYVETGLISVLPLADGAVPATMYLAYFSSERLTRREHAVIQAVQQICIQLQKSLKRPPSGPLAEGGASPAILY